MKLAEAFVTFMMSIRKMDKIQKEIYDLKEKMNLSQKEHEKVASLKEEINVIELKLVDTGFEVMKDMDKLIEASMLNQLSIAKSLEDIAESLRGMKHNTDRE
jgi:translation initiation factor IF-2